MTELPRMMLRRGTQDEVSYAEVIVRNDYRLPERLEPTDTVLDVGAQVGCFAVACLCRGAGKVLCFEPDRHNFGLLQENLAPYAPSRFEARPVAVWRSDREEPIKLFSFVEASPQRTAMAFVHPRGEPVESVGLDSILERTGPVRLLKLDCEGSEFPILYTSARLDLVQEIVGEYHLGDLRSLALDAGEPTVEALKRFLEGKGFKVELVPHPDYPQLNGLFFAKR